MAVGSFTTFNKSLIKVLNGTINLTGTNFYVVLTQAAQPLSAAFTGTSGNCQYSDLTAQLSTANGYTSGGLALSNETLSSASTFAKWTADNIAWTITGSGISCRYAVIFDNSAANKDLLCYCDLETTATGDINVMAGPLWITPDTNGILRLTA